MNLEDLENSLAREAGWRKKEIVVFRSMASRARANSGYLSRAALVLLCAHWEGFLKKSIDKYLKFVYSQNVSGDKLLENFIAIYFYSDVKKAAMADNVGSEEHHLRLARRIHQGINFPLTTPSWDVKTSGNPSSIVVGELLSSVGLNSCLGLDEAKWGATRVFIDEQIVSKRNKIAHGEGLPIDCGFLKDASTRMLEIFDSLSGLILNAAQNGSYLRTLDAENAE